MRAGSAVAGKKRRTGWARTPSDGSSARSPVRTVAANPLNVRV